MKGRKCTFSPPITAPVVASTSPSGENSAEGLKRVHTTPCR